MIIIGELINASRKSIGAAIEAGDAAAIQKVAKAQAEAGAHYIDVNAGIFVGKEPRYLKWLVETVQQVTDTPCAIDNPDPRAIEAALFVHRGTALINSISLEKARYEDLLPIIAGDGSEGDCALHERRGHAADGGRPAENRRRLRIKTNLDVALHLVRLRRTAANWTYASRREIRAP
jgi:hypothetical protein